MKIIITGGAGFIGSNLIDYLLKKKAGDILNLDKLCYSGGHFNLERFNKNPDYTFLQQDICNTDGLDKCINDFQPDFIFHLAAESHVDRSIDSPEAFIDSNIKGTFNVLEVFRKYFTKCTPDKRQKLRLLHISTDEVFGSLADNDKPSCEQDKYQPNSPYSASKAASDHLVRAWRYTYNLPVLISNCSNNYGPYQLPEKLIPLMINKALSGQAMPVYGDGSNIRDWLYVKDHVCALVDIINKGIPGETYNIGGNCQISNIELVRKICDILDELKPGKQSYRKQIEFVTDRPGHDYRYAIDTSKIKSELGWSPKINFNDGIKKTIQWYIDNQKWCDNVCQNTDMGQRKGLGN